METFYENCYCYLIYGKSKIQINKQQQQQK